MRPCSKCLEIKPEKDFYQTPSRKSTYCKNCFNIYSMERWKMKKIEAINYKGCKCIDCNISYPNYPSNVFDFHHLNPQEKEFNWTKLRLKTWDSIKKELDKCVMLCANCHRIRHSQ